MNRPPLHDLILSRLLPEGIRFGAGLDIGCGTGRSTVALKSYCDRVVGVDASSHMLALAQTSAGIDYVEASGSNLPLSAGVFDIVTFAGSLFYLDRQKLISELMRVCQTGADILVYDFKALSEPATKYDHKITFSGLPEFVELTRKEETFTLTLEPWQLRACAPAEATAAPVAAEVDFRLYYSKFRLP